MRSRLATQLGRIAFGGLALGAVVLLDLVGAGAPAAAQILPTTSTTAPPPTTTTTTRPTTTTTRPATTTSRPATTTSRPPSSTTEATPPSTIATPTTEPGGTLVTVPSAGVNGGEGEISPIFPLLSGLGFAVVAGMLGARWYGTRAGG